jgi:hypothetical protein
MGHGDEPGSNSAFFQTLPWFSSEVGQFGQNALSGFERAPIPIKTGVFG